MKTIAIITARGGSKRIPRKNIKPFLGKPIIQYSIEAALKADCFGYNLLTATGFAILFNRTGFKGIFSINSVARAAKTTASSNEFDAKRFAPCAPVPATSPTANKFGTDVLPNASV